MMAGRGSLMLLAVYLIASVPFGYLLFRLSRGGDIRREGSGNIGATNVLRAGGRTAGVATLALDAAKGAAAVWLAGALMGSDPRWSGAAAFTAVAGHCFPIYLRFRGGKGIATGCGAYGLLAPAAMALDLALFATVTSTTRIVSLGSIAAAVGLPLFILWLRPEPPLVVSAAASAALVIARHHANIRRLVAGKEHRFGDDR